MKLFLAGENKPWIYGQEKTFTDFNRLASFYYITKEKSLIPHYKSFMLDSGAYTLQKNMKKKPVKLEDYVNRYIDFINENDVKYFVEVDIDNQIGLDKVEYYRERIEKKTGKKTMPVWHKERGKQYYIDLCREYDYICLGGIAKNTVIKKSDYPVLHWLIKTAKDNNCKLHGLGFTSVKWLKIFDFYSVDSSSWVYGNRSGTVYSYKGGEIYKTKIQGRRVKSRKTAIHNFYEWVKYGEYLEDRI